jgi:tetratricopeptide (TPR) repeat protein
MGKTGFSPIGNSTKGLHTVALMGFTLLVGSGESRGQDYQDWFSRSETAFEKGDTKLEISCLTEAIKRCPEHGTLYGTLYGTRGAEVLYSDRGAAYDAEGFSDQALSDYNKALKFAPTFWAARYNRGTMYAAQHKYKEALEDAEIAVKYCGHQEGPFCLRGALRGATGDYLGARSDLRQATMMNPEDANAYNSLAWLLATCPTPSIRDGSQAVRDATRACKLKGWNDPAPIDTLAAACAESENFHDAVNWELKCLSFRQGSQRTDYQSRLTLYQNHQPFRDTAP